MTTPYARHAQRRRTHPLVIVARVVAVLVFVAFWLGVGVLIAFDAVGGIA